MRSLTRRPDRPVSAGAPCRHSAMSYDTLAADHKITDVAILTRIRRPVT